MIEGVQPLLACLLSRVFIFGASRGIQAEIRHDSRARDLDQFVALIFGSPKSEEQSMLHLFYIRSGFEYFFSTVLIEHLGLQDVVFVLSEPREGIEKRAAEDYSVIYTKNGFIARVFGKKAGKLAFARRVFRELDLAGKRVALYSVGFNETFQDALRSRMERKCAETRYVLLPDGAALLRHLPRKEENPYAFIKLVRKLYSIEPVDPRHTSGSYSSFIDKIYHFPAEKIYADPDKVEIVPVPTSDNRHSNEILIIGGLQGISKEFVAEAQRISDGSVVRYRMHPRNRSGEEFILEQGPDWQELELEGALEEHLLQHPYRLVLGAYSTALMFNHLFVTDSQSHFIIDAENEDPDWQATAEACGIPVTRLVEAEP